MESEFDNISYYLDLEFVLSLKSLKCPETNPSKPNGIKHETVLTHFCRRYNLQICPDFSLLAQNRFISCWVLASAEVKLLATKDKKQNKKTPKLSGLFLTGKNLWRREHSFR